MSNDIKELIAKRARQKLNVQTGQLSNVKNWEVEDSKNGLIISSPLPYANIQDKGGKIKITDKMRAKMWVLYNKTKLPVYKAIAITKNKYITIKKTQYLEKMNYNPVNSRRVKILIKKYIKNV